ncbi:MAG: GNAT family N-acetyltransferase [Lachnospiraceae bacterium]|nr:GNAT family N-acetyltransferase [Lachnospiraceae bacterium]
MQLIYTTSRLILKTLDASYSDRVCDFYSRNKRHFEPWEPRRVETFYTPEFHMANLTYEENEISKYHMLRLWIFSKYNPSEIIGNISFSNMKKGALLNCTLSYKIDSKHVNNGYATEALQFAINLMFKGYGFHRIEAMIHPNNIPSLHVIEKLNFEFEGVAKSYINLDGKWVDHLRYSLISMYQ